MPEMDEIFSDSGKSGKSGTNLKRLFKNKKFLMLAIGVSVVALFVAYKKTQTPPDYDGSEAIGYAGYPTVGGGGDDSSYLDSIQNEYNSSLDEMTKQYDANMDSLFSNINTLSDQILTLEEAREADALKAQRDIDIGQMQANSLLYTFSDNKTQKDALHESNIKIASKYGWDYDEESGQYFENGKSIYTSKDLGLSETKVQTTTRPKTAVTSERWSSNEDYQKKINSAILGGAGGEVINDLNARRDEKISSTGNKKANTTFDKNTDYQALIDSAKKQGASQAVINNLTEQRQAKIDSVYGGKDPGRYTGN